MGDVASLESWILLPKTSLPVCEAFIEVSCEARRPPATAAQPLQLFGKQRHNEHNPSTFFTYCVNQQALSCYSTERCLYVLVHPIILVF